MVWFYASNGFLANRVIKKLAQDENDRFSLGFTILETEIYMDDVLFGSHYRNAAIAKKQVIELCKVDGFTLQKWLVND